MGKNTGLGGRNIYSIPASVRKMIKPADTYEKRCKFQLGHLLHIQSTQTLFRTAPASHMHPTCPPAHKTGLKFGTTWHDASSFTPLTNPRVYMGFSCGFLFLFVVVCCRKTRLFSLVKVLVKVRPLLFPSWLRGSLFLDRTFTRTIVSSRCLKRYQALWFTCDAANCRRRRHGSSHGLDALRLTKK